MSTYIETLTRGNDQIAPRTKIEAVENLTASLAEKADADDIPTKTSDLTNDGDGTNAFLTQHQSLANYYNKTEVDTALSGKAPSGDLTSHVGNTLNPHGVTATQVGLGNCNNTSDANKPISTATQTALNAKENVGKITVGGTEYTVVISTTDAGTAGCITFVVDSL